MKKGRPNTLGKNKVSIRVLFSQSDYEELQKIASNERTDVGTLVRRAVARYFFIPGNGNTNNITQ
ncbi:MAG: hypothetical protein PHR56_06045 [Dehalococcoidales bacterium]|nr:hypothetical protein [Dehalococcoidales bacterium]